MLRPFCIAVSRRLVVLILFALNIATGPFARGDSPPATASPPNIVLILSDDQAWGDYGFMGHTQIRTPHLDRLAEQSLLFTRGYVPTSLCRASLMTMITGLYPHQHGVTGNDPPKGVDRDEMLRHVRTHRSLPQYLAQRGYVSFQAGKWWEGNFKEGGFTQGMTQGDPTKGGRHGDLGLTIGRTGMQPVFDFLDSHKGKPFFLWYAPMLPHQPHNPPPRILERYSKLGLAPLVAKYYANCEWFDETCGQLLDYLEAHHLAENTIVVYLADNGWIQDPAKPQFDPRSKRSPYEGGVRTPIVIRWPGKISPQRNTTTLASSIDLAPTLLAATGIEPTKDLPGVDLRKLADDKASGPAGARKQIFGEIFAHDVVDIERPSAGLQYRWTIALDRKLIVARDGTSELYDLARDPHEKENLAATHPDEVKELQRTIDAWWPAR